MVVGCASLLMIELACFFQPVSVSLRSSPCIRCMSAKRHGCISPCRIPYGFVGVLPSLHGHCQRNNGCARSSPKDRGLWKHWLRNSAPYNLAYPVRDISFGEMQPLKYLLRISYPPDMLGKAMAKYRLPLWVKCASLHSLFASAMFIPLSCK